MYATYRDKWLTGSMSTCYESADVNESGSFQMWFDCLVCTWAEINSKQDIFLLSMLFILQTFPFKYNKYQLYVK